MDSLTAFVQIKLSTMHMHEVVIEIDIRERIDGSAFSLKVDAIETPTFMVISQLGEEVA
jgi:hypothetical protein